MSRDFRLFYASDIHGSERCFLKFLNAGKFYRADAIVLGGDVTGKMVVPLIRRGARHEARLLGRDFVAESAAEIAELEKTIRMKGFYPVILDEAEHRAYQQDATSRQRLIDRLILESVTRWVEIAEQRLRASGIRCFMNAGNDDEPYVDMALRASSVVENGDGGVVDLGGGLQMLTVGYSNRTPFNSPREMDEPELEAHIRRAAMGIADPSRTVFTLHVPPYDSGLDSARLREDLTVATRNGQRVMTPVGSTAVRTLIEEMQPLLGLHGHVHESRATRRIGRTLCINPRSDYSEGVLRGALVTFGAGGIRGHELVQT
jgi:uncharacterized protein